MTVTEKRKAPNLTIKLASALLRIKKDDGSWLIPEPHRSSGTAKEIVALTDFDHAVLHAHGGSIAPQNLYPMIRAEHREKSRGDTTKAAKSKRISAAHEAFRTRLLSKLRGDVEEIQSGRKPRKKAGIKSRGFDKSRSKKFSGLVVERREK